MQNDKLLPCPFCGGEAKIDITGDGGYRVTCKRILGCGCKFEWFDSEDEAIASWNTRKPTECIVEQLESEINESKYLWDEDEYYTGRVHAFEIAKEIVEIVKGGVDNAG